MTMLYYLGVRGGCSESFIDTVDLDCNSCIWIIPGTFEDQA